MLTSDTCPLIQKTLQGFFNNLNAVASVECIYVLTEVLNIVYEYVIVFCSAEAMFMFELPYEKLLGFY